MKPITFENLRRLMGGGRKKKDRGESSFKRSDSFKRISIKRNYLERGGRSRIPHPPSAAGKGRQASPATSPTRAPSPATPPDPVVIGYGQWIRCQLRPKQPSCSSSSDERPPTPPPRRRGSSIANDTSLEIIRLDRSPVVVRRRPGDSAPAVKDCDKDKEAEAASRPDSAISVNLGRVWLDAPMALAMAPRSLELPRPPPQPAPQAPQPGGVPSGGRRAHHSLDSALKESRRFMTPRALSSQTRDSRISSSKDSGFSFSISIPRLADVSPASLSPPPVPLGSGSDGAGGFFRRRKKLSKPAPSVSRDGYFKRTSCGSLSSATTSTAADAVLAAASVRRSSSRKKKSGPGAAVAAGRGSVRGSTRGSTRGSGRRKKTATPAPSVASGTVRSDIYQVVVGRTPRSLNALKLDPMIFVAPEKRKPVTAAAACSRRQPHRYEVQEIRGAFVPRECPARQATDTEDEGLYISPQSAGSLRASSVESLDRLDSLDEADLTPVVATPVVSTTVTAIKEADEKLEATRRPSVTIKTKRNHVTRVMINMPSEGSSSDASEDDADEGLDEGDEELYAPPGFSPVPRCRNVHGGVAARKPVQRRKSARKNVKYLAKPNIHRAPSTLRRARKCEYAALQRRLVAALDTGCSTAHDKSPESDSDGEWI